MTWNFCKLIIVPDFLSFFSNFDSDVKKENIQVFKTENSIVFYLSLKHLKLKCS